MRKIILGMVILAMLSGCTFVDLDDTPNDYAGHAGEVVVVAVTEDGLIFGSDVNIIADVNTGVPSNYILVSNGGIPTGYEQLQFNYGGGRLQLAVGIRQCWVDLGGSPNEACITYDGTILGWEIDGNYMLFPTETTVIDANTIPYQNNTWSLGDPGHKWQNLWITNINGSAYSGGGGGTPAGNEGNVQLNIGGTFGADQNLSYDPDTDDLNVINVSTPTGTFKLCSKGQTNNECIKITLNEIPNAVGIKSDTDVNNFIIAINKLTIGSAVAGTDYQIEVLGQDSTFTATWLEDEHLMQIDQNLSFPTGRGINFGDNNEAITSYLNGQYQIKAGVISLVDSTNTDIIKYDTVARETYIRGGPASDKIIEIDASTYPYTTDVSGAVYIDYARSKIAPIPSSSQISSWGGYREVTNDHDLTGGVIAGSDSTTGFQSAANISGDANINSKFIFQRYGYGTSSQTSASGTITTGNMTYTLRGASNTAATALIFNDDGNVLTTVETGSYNFVSSFPTILAGDMHRTAYGSYNYAAGTNAGSQNVGYGTFNKCLGFTDCYSSWNEGGHFVQKEYDINIIDASLNPMWSFRDDGNFNARSQDGTNWNCALKNDGSGIECN